MDKRYQVFVSSTFQDLKDERQAILRAILEIDHIPAGMELFPASDDGAWRVIEGVIDASDYYVLVIGGRYGSVDEGGLGWTEKEYNFAVLRKKPVLAFLHEQPDNLPRGRTDTSEKAWEQLKAFRAKVERAHTRTTWSNPLDLKAKVIVGLTAEMRRRPGIGWIRADKVPPAELLMENVALQKKLAEFERRADVESLGPPEGSDVLAQGDDLYRFPLVVYVQEPPVPGYVQLDASPTPTIAHNDFAETSWNNIFGAIAPAMIDELQDAEMRKRIRARLVAAARADLHKKLEQKYPDKAFEYAVRDPEIETCIVQLRALGLIKESQRKRTAKEAGTYWTLTPFGDSQMVQIRALRRISPTGGDSRSEEGTG